MGKRQQRIEELELALKQVKRQLAQARRENTSGEKAYLTLQKAAREMADRFDMTKTNDAWQVIADRQRVYIKSLEERLAGTWNPAETHQEEYDAMYENGKSRH